MAEYNDVIKQFKRMCWYYSRDKVQKSCPMCTSYPNCNIGQCRKIAFEEPEHFAATVMQWAAEHPEPQYPTWWEWLENMGIVSKAKSECSNFFDTTRMYDNIPADIAQKHGIEPKEST